MNRIKIKCFRANIHSISEENLVCSNNDKFSYEKHGIILEVLNNKKSKLLEITLSGTYETLEEVNKEKIKELSLIIPNSKEWESKKNFAILVKLEDNNYHRIGLVELSRREGEKLKNKKILREESIRIGRNAPIIKKQGQQCGLEELTKRRSSQLSNTDFQENNKLAKLDEEEGAKEIEHQSKSIQIDYSTTNWTNIHPNFTLELIQLWTNYGFTPEQCRDWLNTISPIQQAQAIQEPAYYAWLRDTKHLTPEKLINHGNLEQLNQEFFNWWQEQQQAQIETT